MGGRVRTVSKRVTRQSGVDELRRMYHRTMHVQYKAELDVHMRRVLNLLYIMDCMCALGAMGTASYDRSKGYASFIPLLAVLVPVMWLHSFSFVRYFPVRSSTLRNSLEFSGLY